MSKSIKLKNDMYIDSSGITHNRKKLSDILENKPIEIFSNGSITSGNKVTINTTWDSIGYFKYLIVKMRGELWNTFNTVIIPFTVFTNEFKNINDSKINANVYVTLPNMKGVGQTCLHIIPYQDITSNSITFDWGDPELTLNAIYYQK